MHLLDRRTLLAGGVAVLVPPAAVAVAGCGSGGGSGTDGVPVSAESTSPSRTPTYPTPAPAPSGLVRADLAAAIAEYLDQRTGDYAVAVHDRRSGAVLSVGSREGTMLSTVKVPIAMAVLRRVGERGRWLTDREDQLMTAMIQRSDNAATNAILDALGTGPVENEIALLRLTSTHFRTDGRWGFSTTVPEDLLLVVDALVDGTSGLRARAERHLLTLMEGVAADQRWGVASPPLPGDLTVRTKNGWGVVDGVYRVNTMGHVLGDGRDHSMSVLGTSPRGYSYGTRTVSGLATTVHEALAERLA